MIQKLVPRKDTITAKVYHSKSTPHRVILTMAISPTNDATGSMSYDNQVQKGGSATNIKCGGN